MITTEKTKYNIVLQETDLGLEVVSISKDGISIDVSEKFVVDEFLDLCDIRFVESKLLLAPDHIATFADLGLQNVIESSAEGKPRGTLLRESLGIYSLRCEKEVFTPDPIPLPVLAVRDFQDLIAFWGAEYPHAIDKCIYKGTSCGASISLYLADGRVFHNGDDKSTLTGTELLKGFTIQTIVEGSDETVDSDFFHIPCTRQSIFDWCEEMESEAEYIWNRDNFGEDLI